MQRDVKDHKATQGKEMNFADIRQYPITLRLTEGELESLRVALDFGINKYANAELASQLEQVEKFKQLRESIS